MRIISQFELSLSDCRVQFYEVLLIRKWTYKHITGFQKRINNIKPPATCIVCSFSAQTLTLLVLMTVEKSLHFLVLMKFVNNIC